MCDVEKFKLALHMPPPPPSPKSPRGNEEEEKEGSGLLAAMVVCVPGLVPPAVHQRGVHFLHPAVRF